MNIDHIVEVAALVNSVTDETDDRIDGKFQSLTSSECMAVLVASELLKGKGYVLNSDNPDTWQWIRELAAHMGATLTEDKIPGAVTRLTLQPAKSH
jgi:hypothetical protein